MQSKFANNWCLLVIIIILLNNIQYTLNPVKITKSKNTIWSVNVTEINCCVSVEVVV